MTSYCLTLMEMFTEKSSSNQAALEPSKEAQLQRLSFFLIYVYCWLYPLVCEILVLQPGIEPVPPALDGGILTTGLPGERFSFNWFGLGLHLYYFLKLPWYSNGKLELSFTV